MISRFSCYSGVVYRECDAQTVEVGETSMLKASAEHAVQFFL